MMQITDMLLVNSQYISETSQFKLLSLSKILDKTNTQYSSYKHSIPNGSDTYFCWQERLKMLIKCDTVDVIVMFESQ